MSYLSLMKPLTKDWGGVVTIEEIQREEEKCYLRFMKPHT